MPCEVCRLTRPVVPFVQVSLLAAMACFVRHGLLGQMEHSRPLAEWVLQQCSSKAAPVRCAMLRSAGLLTEPQFVLALCHEGTHPVHSKEREAAVERHECEVLKALQAQLGAAGASSAMREGLLQLITSAGVHMRSNNAHLLMLAIAVLQLDAREAAVRAAAAEVLAGVAEWRRCSLSDLLFADPRLLEMVGRNISSKPDLLAELAELLDMESPQQLALAILPAALPVVIADADQQGLAVLAEHVSPARQRPLPGTCWAGCWQPQRWTCQSITLAGLRMSGGCLAAVPSSPPPPSHKAARPNSRPCFLHVARRRGCSPRGCSRSMATMSWPSSSLTAVRALVLSWR